MRRKVMRSEQERKRQERGIITPLNAELNPICHLPALLGSHHILHVSRIGVETKTQWKLERNNEINAREFG